MLLLLAAVARLDGNADFAAPYWPQLKRWAAYLEEKGFDPENQLCTDDFAGHLAHNVNLSAKAILALGAYGHARRDARREGRGRPLPRPGQGPGRPLGRGRRPRATTPGWPSTGPGPGARSTTSSGTSSWASTSSRPRSTRKEVAFYLRSMDRYGLPLDNRQPYAKLDWTVWTATMADSRADFEALVNPLVDFLDESPDPRADVRLVLDEGRQAGRLPGPLGGRGRLHQADGRPRDLEEVGRPRPDTASPAGPPCRPRRSSGRWCRPPATARSPGG